MIAACSSLLSTVRRSWHNVFLVPLAAALLALAACNGTAVVTMTSTASTDNFLAYRVDLVSVQLLTASGSSSLTVLPASTIVDFATLTNMDEVLGAAQVSKGTYASAVITLDYSSAQIIYDNGSLNGVSLTPVNVDGQTLGVVQITVTLDPNNSFSVAAKGASLLAMNFNMAASNLVDLNNNTVVVTPLIAASSLPIDSKQVRIRGPLHNVSGSGTSTTSSTSSTTTPYSTPSTTTTTGSFTMGAMPFNSNTSGGGTLSITPTAATTYEINGKPGVGGTGETLLAGLSSGSLAIAYGTLTATDETSTTTQTTTAEGTLEDNIATSTVVTFTATQVLAGSSVQGAGLDRVTGVVTARSGNTLELQDATLVGADGSDTFILGTTQVTIGPNTAITEFGQSTGTYTPAQVSVGSSIDAFGILTSQSSGNATMDASAGRVRLDISTASGLVTVQGSGTLSLNLAELGGRTVGTTAPFVFTGSGVTSAGQYAVSTGSLDLSNSTVGAPVLVTGLTSSFGAATPNFTATTLLDPTTINATLVLDWVAGTTTPFAAFNSSGIDVDIANVGIGVRHEIQVGAQLINLIGLSSDPQIVPSTTTATPNAVFTIGHSVSSTTESFDTFDAFITQLQSELNGSVLATGVTAVGQYSPSLFTLTASSITLFLDN
jgi:hypothetical protein